MEPFEPKSDFEYPMQKPSFDSVVRQKRREAEQKAEQERYKVANLRIQIRISMLSKLMSLLNLEQLLTTSKLTI